MANTTNKVEYFGKVLIDLTEDSVSPNNLLTGITAHDKTGSEIVGTIPIQNGRTITPTDQEQTVVPAGTYIIGDLKVGPIPDGLESWTFTLASGGTVTKVVGPIPSNAESWTFKTMDNRTITRDVEIAE